MWKPLIGAAVAAAALTISACDSENAGTDPIAGSPAATPYFVKAVHYFGESWPKTFWGDFERSAVDAHLERIKADGFDTVILVLPWLGFERGLDDASGEPSELYDRLGWLVGKIVDAQLGFALRVGFPHSFDPDNGIDSWTLCRRMFQGKAYTAAWQAYLGRVAARIEPYRNHLRFAFFSWEDFFCPYAVFPNLPEAERRELAAGSGYQQWLQARYEKSLVELLYLREFRDFSEVPFPAKDSAAAYFSYAFVDQFLQDRLLAPGQAILPELSMEVRVDKDPIRLGEAIHWRGHDMGLDEQTLRGSYWAPYYGAENRGEALTARQALRNFDYMLNNVTDHGRNIRHVVEQFNFVDNTPGYVGHHATIAPDHLPDFLRGAADLLQEKSHGYGLWAYQDYGDYAFYNASFELALRGWETHGSVTAEVNADGDTAARMTVGARIGQTFNPHERLINPALSQQATICGRLETGSLEVHVNGQSMARLEAGSGFTCAGFDPSPLMEAQVEVVLESVADTLVDDLRLYAFVQTLGVYDEFGEPGDLRDLVRRFNQDWLQR